MPKHPDVLIHGSGIVSRAAALLLASQGLRVGLSQRRRTDGGGRDIRAYALNAASRRTLESVRAWPADAHATPVLRMEVHGDDGGNIEFDALHTGAAALAWIVDVPALEDRLEQAIEFQPLVECLDADTMAAADADLQLICEGRDSRLRDKFGIQWHSLPYGQQAVAARLECERPHDGVARQWFHQGEIAALLPMGGPQGNLVALVWSVHEERAGRLLALEDEAFAAELSQACGACLGGMQLAGPRASWPLRLARAERLSGPGWALAGDAAHAVHPLAGQGLNLGLGDVQALARIVGARDAFRPAGDGRLMRAYERERRVELATRGRVSDGLFQLFAHPDARVRTLRNAGMSLFGKLAPIKRLSARAAMGTME